MEDEKGGGAKHKFLPTSFYLLTVSAFCGTLKEFSNNHTSGMYLYCRLTFQLSLAPPPAAGTSSFPVIQRTRFPLNVLLVLQRANDRK